MGQLGAWQKKGTHWVRGEAWHEDKSWGELGCRNAEPPSNSSPEPAGQGRAHGPCLPTKEYKPAGGD